MIADTVNDIINVFRSDVDDVVSSDDDVLWTAADALRYATEAADAVARATQRLYEIIDISVVADTSYVALPARVLNIRHAVLVTAKKKLRIENLNEQSGSDLFDNSSEPCYLVADYRVGSLELFPVPTENDTLRLQCSVTIAAALDVSDDMPFADAADQRLMVTYMKYLAYMKHDAETFDLERAVAYKASFDDMAARRNAEIRRHRRRPGAVRMNW